MSTIGQTAPTAPTATPARPYGWSVLASACARWWRGTLTLLIVIIVNALVQAALVAGDPVPGSDPMAAVLALVSFIVLLVTTALLFNTALLAATCRVGVRDALAKTRRHFWLFCGWAIGWLVVVTLGLMFHTWPGLLIAAITPFVVIAATDGRRNAIGANFRAIGSRFGRYLATLIISGIILLVFHLLATANSFFIGGAAAAFVLWVGLGLVGSWLIVGWSLLYRATTVGQVPFAAAEAGEPAVQ